jgi:hypothetical protein
VRFGSRVKEIVVARGSNDDSRADRTVGLFPGRARKVEVDALHGDGAHDSVLRYYLGGTRLPSASVNRPFNAPVRFTAPTPLA